MLTPFLSISLLANLAGALAFCQVIRGRGGLRYVRSYFNKEEDSTVETGETARARLLSLLPMPEVQPVVFLGDSITAGCEWQELLGPPLRILNRGIGGDTSAGVLNRISAVSKLKPIAVFLMVGTNDRQSKGSEPATTGETIRMIIDQLLQSSPDTHVFIQSVLPSRSPKFNRWSEQVNSHIRQFADNKRITFVDLRAEFTDTDQMLAKTYTHDGLHLNAAGYLLWKQQLDPIMEKLANAYSGSGSSTKLP